MTRQLAWCQWLLPVRSRVVKRQEPPVSCVWIIIFLGPRLSLIAWQESPTNRTCDIEILCTIKRKKKMSCSLFSLPNFMNFFVEKDLMDTSATYMRWYVNSSRYSTQLPPEEYSARIKPGILFPNFLLFTFCILLFFSLCLMYSYLSSATTYQEERSSKLRNRLLMELLDFSTTWPDSQFSYIYMSLFPILFFVVVFLSFSFVFLRPKSSSYDYEFVW